MPLLDGKRVLLTGASGFIGTNLIDFLAGCGAAVVNVDIDPPLCSRQSPLWRRCDVGDLESLRTIVNGVDPHVVVHLAARTDTDSVEVSDYAINYMGTRNVVQALSGNTERFVFVSSQFVVGPDATFRSETDYAPHSAYGESKVQAELGLRADPPQVPWTIVRPTNVWGPWHLRYRTQFWRVLERGMYLHPSAPDPIRSYAYVGSVCLQMLAVLLADEAAVNGRALYVGDFPVRLSQWVDAFSSALRGKPARRVPGRALASLARIGDVVQRTGVRAPLNSSRFLSMTSDYPTPMERTEVALGGLPSVPLAIGIMETVSWLHDGHGADPASWVRHYLPAMAKEPLQADG